MNWISRFPRAAIAILGVLLIVVGATAVGFLNLRNLQRIDVIHGRISDLETLRELRQRLEISLLDQFNVAVPSGTFLWEDVHLQVQNALAMGSRLDPQTANGLRRIEALLSRPGVVSRESLVSALEVAGSISERETRAQEDLLRRVREDGRREFYLGIGGLLGLAALTAVAAWLLPKRLLDPLSNLRTQFAHLGAGQFREMSLEGVDSALVPLFKNYNAMVGRLSELEAERRARAETLEGEVRAGARALLDQQRALANAERLAAVGETAAGMAHELRNPLAGILAALENLQREVDDPSLSPRLRVLHLEAERVVRLLNDYLAASRHAPEPAVVTDIGEMVRDLLSFLRYQAAPGVKLKPEVEDDLRCLLPQGRIRQTLLNLVGNSLQALGSSTGTVSVSATRRDHLLRLEVRDDGPGFPEDLLPVVGQPFRTGRANGTGLGLATVQRTVRELGGSMSITNVTPRGASVVLSLPCQKREQD
ncbi:MAG: HAMP domain-containing sensor histidine kinase [Gemmatimonadota bacterium]|jgi:signal transduction histidine kinase